MRLGLMHFHLSTPFRVPDLHYFYLNGSYLHDQIKRLQRRLQTRVLVWLGKVYHIELI